MPQNGLLESPEGGTGVEPEFLAEDMTGGLVRPQRLRLPLRSVQGEHELAPWTLSEWVGGHEGFEVGHDAPMATEGQSRLQPVLSGAQTKLFEPVHGGAGEGLPGKIGQRRAPPEGQSLVQPIEGDGRLPGGQGRPALLGQALEAPGVDLVGGDLEDVARGAGGQQAGGAG